MKGGLQGKGDYRKLRRHTRNRGLQETKETYREQRDYGRKEDCREYGVLHGNMWRELREIQIVNQR